MKGTSGPHQRHRVASRKDFCGHSLDLGAFGLAPC